MTDRVAMTLRLPAEDREQLRRISFERRMPINEIVRRAVHALVSSTEEQEFLLDDIDEKDDLLTLLPLIVEAAGPGDPLPSGQAPRLERGVNASSRDDTDES